MALKVFYRALKTYKINLGPEEFANSRRERRDVHQLKTANLVFCLAHIYKDRAEAMYDPETPGAVLIPPLCTKTFEKIDREKTGFVSLGQLEPALQSLFKEVDLAICHGPQTIVALLLEVYEGAETDGSGSLDPKEFASLFQGCMFVIAKGYFNAAAAALEGLKGAEYEFVLEAKRMAAICAGEEPEEPEERESEEKEESEDGSEGGGDGEVVLQLEDGVPVADGSRQSSRKSSRHSSRNSGSQSSSRGKGKAKAVAAGDGRGGNTEAAVSAAVAAVVAEGQGAVSAG